MMITFEYGSTTLTLPNPLLNDTEEIKDRLILHRMMTGDIYTYIHRMTSSKIALDFDKIDATERDALIAFLDESQGGIVTYTDWLGTVWTGHIITTVPNFVSLNSCDYSVTLEFEGVENG